MMWTSDPDARTLDDLYWPAWGDAARWLLKWAALFGAFAVGFAVGGSTGFAMYLDARGDADYYLDTAEGCALSADRAIEAGALAAGLTWSTHEILAEINEYRETLAGPVDAAMAAGGGS